MAQLIKLKDCISRYEWNTYRYSSQFIRLKQEQWGKLYNQWQDESELTEPVIEEEHEEQSTFDKFKSIFKKNKASTEVIQEQEEQILPETELQLRHYFLDKLFPFQLKWATSTVSDVSFVYQQYERDETLKFFLQRLPDIYLLMYYPIFNIKKAPVDAEIILISPVSIEVIYLLESDEQATFYATDDRSWTKETPRGEETIISPIISLKRTEKIIESIMKKHDVSFKINKVILSRKNDINYYTEPYLTSIIGRSQFEEWLDDKKALSSPLKSQQLKVAEVLLSYCLTNSVKRPEWNDTEESFATDGAEEDM
ncbi:MAG TPA: NERD domain-containing protein [Bacillota bacterium]|nr:NERD domain-containing protein [Bacillota bacterium]